MLWWNVAPFCFKCFIVFLCGLFYLWCEFMYNDWHVGMRNPVWKGDIKDKSLNLCYRDIKVRVQRILNQIFRHYTFMIKNYIFSWWFCGSVIGKIIKGDPLRRCICTWKRRIRYSSKFFVSQIFWNLDTFGFKNVATIKSLNVYSQTSYHQKKHSHFF